ncbi:LysR family transcriptional regulator [Palleronia sp. LCG004]|uniref:LysR family transcriptional regulator n=1 Tax=Palleronia sp. LCG004 TaxID=3079304 RepID=UPI002941CA08|nr:LysR family transcriptional regulator [Palleronia sp. LCG004]WOI58329.1 LysR family transcriptional regulator [Palleronia sp. LCG004]
MSSGSMTGAARYLGIGQPAVTRMVRDLEASVGFQLFHRNGPRISPTDRGLRFYEEVQRLTAGMREIRARAGAIRDERLPGFDVAATPTMAGGLVGPAMAALGPGLPELVTLKTMSAEHVARALKDRSADYGLSAFPFDHADLKRHVIAASNLVAAVPTGGPFDRAGPMALAEVADTRLVTVGNAYRIRHTIDRAFADAGIETRRQMATNSSLNAVMAARAGLGVAIVDPVTAWGIPIEGVTIRPLAVDLPYLWCLFSASGRSMPSVLAPFADAFRVACAETIPGCRFIDPDDTDLIRRLTTNGGKP